MKLIYISHWRFPSDKTMSPLIMRTCEELARQGVEVELWTPRRVNMQYPNVDPFGHYNIERNFSIKKLPVVDLMPWIGGSLGFLLMVFTFAVSVWWKARTMPDDVVLYFHDLRDAFFVRKKYMVLEVHDFYESAFGWVNRGVFRRISGLVVTNRIKMKHLAKAYGIPESRMIHLPNAVDVERFNRRETKEEARTKLGLAKDRKLAVYTGSLFTWKGIHTLARAAKFLPGDWEVIFAGGNNHERAEFRAFLDRERLTNVTLLPLPYEDRERAPLFMRAADVVVLPNTAHNLASKYETSPVKLFEYMASGTPIIASDLPSIRNIADEGMVWFFKADNPQSLAEAVMRISYDPAAAEKKAEVAEQAVQAYAWERRIPTVISFIRGIS